LINATDNFEKQFIFAKYNLYSMQDVETIISDKLSEAFKIYFNLNIPSNQIKFQKTHFDFNGDITFVVFPFVKLAKTLPDNLAKILGEYISKYVECISTVETVKGFLNITVSDNYYVNWLKDNYKTDSFVLKQKSDNPPILLEFSSPNTNKPLHLGHVRNNLLGWSLAQILVASGKNVVKLNLVNDRGIHICKSMLAYLKWGNGETPESSGIKGDKLVGKYYVLFEKQYKSEITELVSQGKSEEEAMKIAPSIIEAQELLRRWEFGDKAIIDLWHTMNSWVYEGFNKTYERLGIQFDKTYYESEVYQYGKQIIEKGLAEGKIIKEADGSIWADLTDEGLGKKILLRSDGTSVYITQDIGTAVLRYNEFKPSQIIYVVGNEQIYHFDVLTKILKKLGFEWYEKIFHLSYGMVELPEGKMKTREGKVIDADDLMDEMYITAKLITSQLGKASELENTKADELYNIIGLGALKYFILKIDPKKNILFNPDESIDFNGNTGPFIQYTYARINSLLAKAKSQGIEPGVFDSEIKILKIEKNIIKLLREYPNIIQESADELNPAIIANYIYELTKSYNQFYQEVPILKENDNMLKSFRLSFSILTGKIIKSAMLLLGIQLPEKM